MHLSPTLRYYQKNNACHINSISVLIFYNQFDLRKTTYSRTASLGNIKIPVIIITFSTISKAEATYQHIEKITRDHFKNHGIFWLFSSRIIALQLQRKGRGKNHQPVECFNQLAKLSYKSAKEYSNTDHLIDQTNDAGYQEIHIIPLVLTAYTTKEI